jgi:hypothetical protein
MKLRKKSLLTGAGALCLGSMLVACGGGGGSGSAAVPVTPVPPVTPVTPLTPLTLSKIEYAQTHVIPETGLAWTIPNDSQSLHLVGGRDALVLVSIGQADVKAPVLEGWRSGARIGSLPLNPPASLPATEAGGTPYASDRWSVTVPAAWLTAGLTFKVAADNYSASAERGAPVGLDTDMKLSILPLYLFGANDTNTQPFSAIKTPSAAQQAELLAKWPVAKLTVDTIGRADWPSVVIPPRADSAGTARPAYVITSMDQQKDGFAAMSAVLGLLAKYREANGEGATNNQYYVPLLPIDTGSGKYHGPGGGLAFVGGGAAVGDYAYAGIAIHELGHGFGMDHAGAAFDSGNYPYVNGSLKGSAWGYDVSKNQFLNVLVPADARTYAGCATSHQLDSSNRCYKQDPMQGGSGDQAAGYIYTMFADFYAGKIQYWFEGKTTTDTGGNHVFSGGRILVDAKSATGYSRWDSIAQARVPVTPATTNKGLYGNINQGLPTQTGVAVYAIAITMSLAGTPGATQIYPPLSRTGNLVQVFDPTSTADLSAITPNTGTYPWYCHASGCDYTVRVTYSDGAKLHRVLEGGFRNWFQPTVAPAAASLDPISGSSYQAWVINVPAAKTISKIELLDTPMVWNGLPATPTVLASR